MFDYDRELNIAHQLAKANDDVALNSSSNRDRRSCTATSNESLMSISDDSSRLEAEEEEQQQEDSSNSIVRALSGLLRRCSSPNNAFQNDLSQFRQKSATVGSGYLNSLAQQQAVCRQQQQQQQHPNGLPNTGILRNIQPEQQLHQQQLRRWSGGSAVALDNCDCGASSGYGSPGFVGTPLSSPSAMNCTHQFVASQLQKMCAEQQQQQNVVGQQSTGTVLKATTTTTGTNKNSNKRKTSISEGGPPAAAEQIVPTEDGFDFREIKEFTHLLSSPRRLPPSRYICHICYQPGHYISDCPSRFSSPYEELTPYQGRKKCYGEFQCEQCKRKWTSQNSVANEAQNCIKCHVPVFPHKQLPVDKAVALGLIKLQRLPVANVSPSGIQNFDPNGTGVMEESPNFMDSIRDAQSSTIFHSAVSSPLMI